MKFAEILEIRNGRNQCQVEKHELYRLDLLVQFKEVGQIAKVVAE